MERRFAQEWKIEWKAESWGREVEKEEWAKGRIISRAAGEIDEKEWVSR